MRRLINLIVFVVVYAAMVSYTGPYLVSNQLFEAQVLDLLNFWVVPIFLAVEAKKLGREILEGTKEAWGENLWRDKWVRLHALLISYIIVMSVISGPATITLFLIIFMVGRFYTKRSVVMALRRQMGYESQAS